MGLSIFDKTRKMNDDKIIAEWMLSLEESFAIPKCNLYLLNDIYRIHA